MILTKSLENGRSIQINEKLGRCLRINLKRHVSVFSEERIRPLKYEDKAMNMDFKLDFAVIGIQKSATTWLYKCLQQHPDIDLRNNKREFDYFGSPNYHKNGKEWYTSLFQNDGSKLKGCVSVEYIEDVKMPSFLQQHNPDLKIIISIRPPIHRLISAYHWGIRKSLLPNLPLEKGLQQLLQHYDGNIENDYTRFYLDLINRGLFSERLANFAAVFPANQIHIIQYNDIKKNPKNVMIDLFKFLKINHNFVPTTIFSKPKKNAGSTFINSLERGFAKNKVISKVADILNQISWSDKKSDITEQISAATLNRLEMIFEEEQQKLNHLLNSLN